MRVQVELEVGIWQEVLQLVEYGLRSIEDRYGSVPAERQAKVALAKALCDAVKNSDTETPAISTLGDLV